jgi:hypothetical protein
MVTSKKIVEAAPIGRLFYYCALQIKGLFGSWIFIVSKRYVWSICTLFSIVMPSHKYTPHFNGYIIIYKNIIFYKTMAAILHVVPILALGNTYSKLPNIGIFRYIGLNFG